MAATRNEQDFHLLVTSKDGKTIKDYVGWAPGRYLVKNVASFHLYRKFSTEEKITFESIDEIPDDKTKEEPVKAPVKKQP